MYPSNASDSDEEELQDRFGPLLLLDSTSLITLASRIRHEVEGNYKLQEGTVSTLSGSYNLVHIVEFPDGIKYVIRIPATGWGDRFDATARQALISQALTMRFIAEKTHIPIPKIYGFDAGTGNEIKAPYIAMSYIPGRPVISVWFEDEGSVREERRDRILDTVAQVVCQLDQLRFHQIGSLDFQPDGQIAIGPCFEWDEGTLGEEGFGKDLQIKALGPFQSTSTYLKECLRRSESTRSRDPYKLGLGSKLVIDRAISYLPAPQNGEEVFALSIPDFGPQNVMVDNQGILTGILDWDLVQTEPYCFGPYRYPNWITRDWDPLLYGYPLEPKEDSPHQLSQYRQRYHAQVKSLQYCTNADYALKSHIYEAVVIAATSRLCRLEIALKFVGRALLLDGHERQFFVTDLGEDEVSDTPMQHFEERLKAILAIIPQEANSTQVAGVYD